MNALMVADGCEVGTHFLLHVLLELVHNALVAFPSCLLAKRMNVGTLWRERHTGRESECGSVFVCVFVCVSVCVSVCVWGGGSIKRQAWRYQWVVTGQYVT